MRKKPEKKAPKSNEKAWALTPKMLDEMREYRKYGATHKNLYQFYNIPKDVFYKTKRENAELEQALGRGEAQGILDVAGMLYEKAMHGDLKAAMFYLTYIGGWSEKAALQKENETLDDELDKIRKDMCPIEATRIYQKIMGN